MSKRNTGRTCSIIECERAHLARGLCRSHYSTVSRSDDLPPTQSVEERFWLNVKRQPDGLGCWEWIAWTTGRGYGHFYAGARRVLAHRWSFEHFTGLPVAGLDVHHMCRNRRCVNPAHLVAMPKADHARLHGLAGTGDKSWLAAGGDTTTRVDG